jgi:hypothetical protein
VAVAVAEELTLLEITCVLHLLQLMTKDDR